MSKMLLAACALAALAACETPSAPPSSPAAPGPAFAKAGVVKQNYMSPLVAVFYDTCNDDTIAITGKAHTVTTMVSTDTSNYFSGHTNTADVSGVGKTGIRYRFIQIYDQELSFVLVPPFPNRFLDRQVLRVISAGSDSNELVDVTNVMIFDGANFTVEQTYRSRCTP